MSTSIWRRPGFRPLLALSFFGFTGYAILLPVAPLWAVHGGADSGGAGLVNGVMLLFTVLTQLGVPAALRRWGWAPVLVVGMLLLGLPAAAYAVSDALPVVLALSAARGIGFGVLTVTGSSATAALVEGERRGEAIGAYGLAVALPNVLLLPVGPWLAEHVSFGLVFAIAALPVVGVPAGLRVAAAVHVQAPDLLHGSGADASDTVQTSTGNAAAYRALLRPVLLLLAVTLAGGAVITFAPQMVGDPLVVGVGLLLMGLVTALSRWGAGYLADRHGVQPFLWPLALTTVAGTAVIAWTVDDPDTVHAAAFLAAMVLLGLPYGALQNLTLVAAFAAVGRRHHNFASAVWNIGFDLGTALGSVAVGWIAVATSFRTALLVAALLAVPAVPLALLRARPPRGRMGP